MASVSSSDNYIDPADVAAEADNYESDIEEKKEQIEEKENEIEEKKEQIEDKREELNGSFFKDELVNEVLELQDELTEVEAELTPLVQELTELETEGASIIVLNEECENYARGSSLINENYFPTYIKELAKDCGDITEDSWLYIYIDWDRAAEDSKMDYTTITFKGTDFYVHG